MNNLSTSDGSYALNYKLGPRWVKKAFGYYTNGSPLESGSFVTIQDTTITVKSYSY